MAPIEIGPYTFDAWIIALGWGLIDVAIVIGLYRLLSAVGRLRGPLWYLSPLQFEIVKGLVDVRNGGGPNASGATLLTITLTELALTVGQEGGPTPEQAARNPALAPAMRVPFFLIFTLGIFR